MKIICIGRNYSEHALEMKAAVPDAPVIFLKPQTALLQTGKPLLYPPWTTDLHYETELVFRICKQGKYIDEQFAHRYYDAVTVGLDFTARDLQSVQKEKRLPWEISKAFDQSAAVGTFIPLNKLKSPDAISFGMKLNGELRQQGNSSEMLFSLPQIIAYASQFFTLQQGDLIFTGTPVGVGPVKIGDRIACLLEEQLVLEVAVK